ncbi:hypothetical protein Tco_0008619 [Tanacetum coccineum]
MGVEVVESEELNRWNKAEKAAEGIISKFQPTIIAERKRDSVISYLQRLLKHNLDCEMLKLEFGDILKAFCPNAEPSRVDHQAELELEVKLMVFAYGSVPLKTYLPDGDIDLSAIGANTHDFIKDIASLLESEGKNSSAEFVVKDVQLIGAEVKLVKCMVQNLVVDISVNQIGGLSTLCFLEQVDRIIKKDHLFKRSIILIKAWCYFESRTLGAHVGLISTYGLETLVLYIFHVFHIELDGPLSVLYKFLEYFSTFDWDNYGISLMGPVRLSEMPRIVAERPPNSNALLLNVGFLRRCSETLSVPMRPRDVFSKKHLNIVDPLNDRNNLGRSVSQGNFFRIRSAFGYGARKLEQILTSPGDKLTEELHAFFTNTLNMHGSGQRPDLPDSISSNVSILGAEQTFATSVNGKPRSSNDENAYLGSESPGNQISKEGNDVSANSLSSEEEAADHVSIPFYAPHLLLHHSKSVNKTEKSDTFDAKQSEVHEEKVPCAVEEVLPSEEQLDLTGDLMAHLVCLDHVRWWSSYVFGPHAMMSPPPPPPPPPILLSMIVSEHGGGMNGVVRHPHYCPSDHMFMSRPPFLPNDPNQRGARIYYLDQNRSRPAYQTSTSNATNNRASSRDEFTAPPEGVPGCAPVTRPVQHREPLSHKKKNQKSNQARQPDGSQRPRSVSGMDRLNVPSAYHLKDEDDFPPLSS